MSNLVSLRSYALLTKVFRHGHGVLRITKWRLIILDRAAQKP